MDWIALDHLIVRSQMASCQGSHLTSKATVLRRRVYGAQSTLKNEFLQVTLVEKLPSIFVRLIPYSARNCVSVLVKGIEHSLVISGTKLAIITGMFW